MIYEFDNNDLALYVQRRRNNREGREKEVLSPLISTSNLVNVSSRLENTLLDGRSPGRHRRSVCFPCNLEGPRARSLSLST